jgi:hypothetical protein
MCHATYNKKWCANVVTLSHILALDAIEETFSDPKLATKALARVLICTPFAAN